jgi:transmembrane 9 superfamily member 2/4
MRLFVSAPFLVAALIHGVAGFYLPGVAPTNYHEGDPVPVFVNTITPSLSQTDQQLRSLISYDCIYPQ